MRAGQHVCAESTWKKDLTAARQQEAADFLAERHKERLQMEGVVPADDGKVLRLSLIHI